MQKQYALHYFCAVSDKTTAVGDTMVAQTISDNSDGNNEGKYRTTSARKDTEIVHTYEDALDIAGNGAYNLGLLAVLSTASLAMGIDMFGFSVVVSGAECDFHLNLSESSILLSMPFIGPIVMAYPWGYISDTRGRRRSLLIAMWGSFLVSIASAFSPNWVWLAVFKFFSTSLCSCAQSTTYTMLGESCAQKMRDPFMLIMTSVLDFSLAIYVGIAYFILNMEFSISLGLITFTPWRLLVIALALPLGISAFFLHFYYESPKFLINAGKEQEALEGLRNIWRRNGGEADSYPVKKLVLTEEGNEKHLGVPLFQSLWEQIVPLFKPPLLWRTMQLYYLTAAIYSTNNSFFIWFPYLADIISVGLADPDKAGQNHGLCNMIDNNENNSTNEFNFSCSSKLGVRLVWSSLAQGVTFVIIMFAVTKLAARKKMLMIVILTTASVCAAGAVFIKDNMASVIMFFGLLTNQLCIGIVFSYFVDLYPTSYRGMAACLAVMVARGSALAGVNLVGAFVATHCGATLYICSAYLLSAVAVSCLLPPDKTNKK